MARAKKLSENVIEELRCERADLDAREHSLRPWAEEMAKIHGVSVHTIYRQSAPEISGRKRRSDAGSLRAMEAAALADIAALTTRFHFTADQALSSVNSLRKKRGLEPYTVHEETVRRHLRQLGLSRLDSRTDRRVHRRWEAPYPGYLWQMDSTVAASYYIDTDNSIGYEAPVVHNKTKAGNGKPRVWLLCIVDDYSRVKWARYYTGNNASVWRDMIVRAMRKGDFGAPDVWPAYGVPERIYTDQDAAMKARESIDFLAAFEIERMLANPSTEHFTNAQAKGKVERAIGHILHGFETITRAKRFTDLDEMNEVLKAFLTTINNRVHGTTGVAPFERWLEAPQVRVLPTPEIVRRVSARSEECSVSPDLSIRLEKKTYQLPRREPFIDFVKRKVSVRYFKADLSKIIVILNGEAHEIDAVEAVPDAAGEFKTAPVPASVELKKELLERDLSKYDSVVHGIFDEKLEQDPRSYPIRPQEVEHPVTHAQFAAPMIRRGKAISRLQGAELIARPPTADELAAVKDLMAGRSEIPEPELEQFIEARRRGDAPGVVRLRAQNS